MDAHGNEDSRATTVKPPEGWKMVPVEPTEEMVLQAILDVMTFQPGTRWEHIIRKSYAAMLSASPSPPVGGGSAAGARLALREAIDQLERIADEQEAASSDLCSTTTHEGECPAPSTLAAASCARHSASRRGGPSPASIEPPPPDAHGTEPSKPETVMPGEQDISVLQSAVENLRSPDKSDERTIDAAWRIASQLEAMAKRLCAYPLLNERAEVMPKPDDLPRLHKFLADEIAKAQERGNDLASHLAQALTHRRQFAASIEPQVPVAQANEACGPEAPKPPSPSEIK